jgi:hypothetical protein
MRFFDSTLLFKSLVVTLAISKVDADFVLAQFHDHGSFSHSVACSSNSLGCECWETGPQVFDSNWMGNFFSLPAGICEYEHQLDFYYNYGGGDWYFYPHNGDGKGVGTCHFNTQDLYECPDPSSYYEVTLWCTSVICV